MRGCISREYHSSEQGTKVLTMEGIDEIARHEKNHVLDQGVASGVWCWREESQCRSLCLT